MSKVKLLFLAIDGLDYDLIHKYECEYLLWLMGTNQHGVLVSDDPSGCNRRGEPLTGSAWRTVYTGVPAYVHGVTAEGWLRRASEIRQVSTIWEILGKQYSLGLLALPVYVEGRVRPLNGWAINGFMRMGELKRGDMYPELDIPEWFRLEEYHAAMADKPDNMYEMQRKQVEDKLRLLKHLPRKEIMAVGIQMIDWHSHLVNDRKEAYGFIDDWMMRVMEEVLPERFLICSDHGFQDIRYHSQRAAYIVSMPGGELPRTIYDVAPLTLFIMGR